MNIDELYAPWTKDGTDFARLRKDYTRLVRHMEFVRLFWDDVHECKEHLANEEIEEARACWERLPEEARIGLNQATTKGGIFTIEERALLNGRN